MLAVWSDEKVLVDNVAGTSSRYLTVRSGPWGAPGGLMQAVPGSRELGLGNGGRGQWGRRNQVR